jgi:Zn ribbon nucleic-acid-binding protein
MSYPDGLLVACPSCSAWPMSARLKTTIGGGEERCVSFKCVKCGHKERGLPAKALAAVRSRHPIKTTAVHLSSKSTAAV